MKDTKDKKMVKITIEIPDDKADECCLAMCKEHGWSGSGKAALEAGFMGLIKRAVLAQRARAAAAAVSIDDL